MPRWFGKRRPEEEGAAAVDALLGAAQERSIPTMRVDDPEELAVSLGVAAYQDGDRAPAEDIFRRVAAGGRRGPRDRGHGDGEPRRHPHGRGDLAGAEGLLRAVESGTPQWAPRAAFNLGGVLALQGRSVEAEAAFRRAVDSGHPDDAPAALTHLAALYFRTGRFDESERAYQGVLATGHPEFVPLARAGLADLQRRF